MLLTSPLALASRTAPSRVLFGPHETNLGRGRAFSDRHVAYYASRVAGGAGVVVTETASVHASDWPYERAPLAAESAEGWRAVVAACPSALVLASLGHSGNQGSSAYSQAPLWGASAVADAVNREQPQVMEDTEIALLTEGFVVSARLATEAGCAGVEVEAGDRSLLRQFLSGVTNTRADRYGDDKALLLREVLTAVRSEVPGVLSLRLSCDELAPWAGVTPDNVRPVVEAVADLVDLLVVVRAGPFAGSAYRPDAHVPEAFNTDLCRSVWEVVAGRAAVVLQGSVVTPEVAERALADGVADLVEMTRAQIAEPRLVEHLRAGTTPRPCVLCNQACRVRDARNPLVSCIGEPRSGHETTDPEVAGGSGEDRPDLDRVDLPRRQADVLVVGGGPAGLECARVLALRGRRVTIREASAALGGAVNDASLGAGRETLRALTGWLAAECDRLGVEVVLDSPVTEDEITAFPGEVVLCTGSRRRDLPPYGVPVLDSRQALRGLLPEGPALVHDPVGGPVGVSVAEKLAAAGREVRIVTGDPVVGTLLSLTGDLADCNTRLQRAGVPRELKSLLRSASDGVALLEDVWTGTQREVPCAFVVDCGHRLPDESLHAPGRPRAGDCVAPRTVLEAVLEGRRRALELS